MKGKIVVMQNNERGVTIVALAITIIVLFLLSAISINIGLDSIRKSRYYSAISQMKVMQSKINELYEDYNGRMGNTYGVKIETLEEKEQERAKKAFSIVKTENLTEGNIGDFEEYRFFSKDYITNTLDVAGIEYDFIVNLDKRTVILIDGIKFNNEKYYALCQIEGEKYNVEYTRKPEYVENGIILHYDAIKNTSTGHNATTNIWEDISGNGKHAELNGYENTIDSGWLENGLICNGENNYFKTANVNLEKNSSLTISVTFTENKFVGYYRNNHLMLTSDNGWSGFQFHTYFSNSSTKLLDGTIYIGGNYNTGGNNCRFIPSELKGYKTQVGKTDNITYTYEKATKQACVYINGKLVANKIYTAETDPIQYFMTGTGNYKTYHSLLIYNRALSSYEVQKNYEVENKKYKIEE